MTGTVRIIGGKWKRRRIDFPLVLGLRPTPDRVRETLFNWLRLRIKGARCLDLFAGSGALGFEAASRGAAEVVMVDRNSSVAYHLRKHVQALGTEVIHVLQADAMEWVKRPIDEAHPWGVHGTSHHYPMSSRGLGGLTCVPFDIVFLDPPFGKGLLEPTCEYLERGDWLSRGAFVYLEAERRILTPPVLPPNWIVKHSNKAGLVRYYLAERECFELSARLPAPV